MKKLLYLLLFVCSFAQSQMILDSYRYVTAGGAVYQGANAADPSNEVNGTANFTVISNHTLTSDSGTVQNGTYSVKMTRDVGTGTNEVVRATMVGVNDTDNVDVAVYVAYDTGVTANWQWRAPTAGGWSTLTAQGFSGSGFQLYTLAGIVATSNDPYIEFRSLAGATTNEAIFIDNIVITVN